MQRLRDEPARFDALAPCLRQKTAVVGLFETTRGGQLVANVGGHHCQRQARTENLPPDPDRPDAGNDDPVEVGEAGSDGSGTVPDTEGAHGKAD